MFTYLLFQQSPGEIKRSKVDLGFPSCMDRLVAESFLNSRFSDIVSATLFSTAV